jgi:hypothetical protein
VRQRIIVFRHSVGRLSKKLEKRSRVGSVTSARKEIVRRLGDPHLLRDRNRYPLIERYAIFSGKSLRSPLNGIRQLEWIS